MADVYDSDYDLRPEAGRKKRPTVYSDSDAESEIAHLSRTKPLLQSTGSEDEGETRPQPSTGRSASSAVFRKPINAWSAKIPANSTPIEAFSPREPAAQSPTAHSTNQVPQPAEAVPYGAQFRLGKEYKKQAKQDMANSVGVGAHTSVFRGSDQRQRPAARSRVALSLPPPVPSSAPSTSSFRTHRPPPDPDPLPSPTSFHDDLFSAPPTPRTAASTHPDLPPSTPSVNEQAPPQAPTPALDLSKRTRKAATTHSHSIPSPTHLTPHRYPPAPLPTPAPTRSPAPKPRMVTVLISDRRADIEELAEIRVQLKPYEDPESGPAYWADAKEVCEKLQSGPSRIDGPAKVYAMRGRYRQNFLRIAPDGTETSQSANLKVQRDRTLSIFVEGLPGTTMPISSPAVVHEPSYPPLTPVSSSMSLRGSPAPSDFQPHLVAAKNKRKRAGSSGSIAQTPYFPSILEGYSPETVAPSSPAQSPPTDMYRTSVPPVPAKKVKNAPRLEPLMQPTPQHASPPATPAASLSRPSSVASIRPPSPGPLLVPPTEYVAPDDPDPTSSDDDLRIVKYLMPTLQQDGFGFLEFKDTLVNGQGQSNSTLMKWYGWVQAKVEKYANGSARAPPVCGGKVIEPKHVLTALGLSERWYEVCRETLQYVMAYGPEGQRYRDERAVAALNDKTPRDGRLGVALPTELLVLLRRVHEEWSAMADGTGA